MKNQPLSPGRTPLSCRVLRSMLIGLLLGMLWAYFHQAAGPGNGSATSVQKGIPDRSLSSSSREKGRSSSEVRLNRRIVRDDHVVLAREPTRVCSSPLLCVQMPENSRDLVISL